MSVPLSVYVHTLEDAGVFSVEAKLQCYSVTVQTDFELYWWKNFPSFWTPHKCVMCSWHQFLWVSFEGLDPREQNRGCEALQVWIVVKANSCVCFTPHNVIAILSSFFFLAVIITSAGLGNSLMCTSLWIKLLVVTKNLNDYYTYTAIAIIHVLCCLALLDLCHVPVMYNNGLL
jgi:hypothetical protein